MPKNTTGPALFFIGFLCAALSALVVNPVVDTDKSVNTASANTILSDLIEPSMTDMQKLDAVYSFHRRMMHHFRLDQATEDNQSTFDVIKLYTVYGHSFCTQQSVVFRALCGLLWGNGNVMVAGGQGTLASLGTPGGHSSFQIRFHSGDKWHWVDPIIGAYAVNPAHGAIASLDEIRDNGDILAEAAARGHASMPYFPCTSPPKPDIGNFAAAYAYYDYDTTFVREFAGDWNGFDTYWARQSPYFTTRKNLKKGEMYVWLWDFLEGDYFNFCDKTYAHVDGILTRDWALYPPRHLCGWKDSLDRKNWPYFKPYKKIIKGEPCYRYYANGLHLFSPDLNTDEATDDPVVRQNVSFYCEDSLLPHVRPASVGSVSVIAYKFKLPYPLMSMRVSGNFVRKNAGDSLSIFLGRSWFNKKEMWTTRYQDSLTTFDTLKIMDFPVSAGADFDTTVREAMDPLYAPMYRVFYGYIIYFVMKAENGTADVGINDFKVEGIFQHNMFALPQLEPGQNRVTVTRESASGGDDLRLFFKWFDNGIARTHEQQITADSQSYTITVNQDSMPRMLLMALGNASDMRYADTIATEKRAPDPGPDISLLCYPNPFNAAVVISYGNYRGGIQTTKARNSWNTAPTLSIYDTHGRTVHRADMKLATYTWNASGLPSGVYLLRARIGHSTLTRKLILLR